MTVRTLSKRLLRISLSGDSIDGAAVGDRPKIWIVKIRERCCVAIQSRMNTNLLPVCQHQIVLHLHSAL